MADITVTQLDEIVSLAASDIWRKWKHAFDWDELKNQALTIAWERKGDWAVKDWRNPVAGMRVDLRWHLASWVNGELYARGWRKRGPRGKQEWVRSEIPRDPQSMVNLGYDNDPDYVRLAVDWEPMSHGERQRYARTLEQNYPALVGDFMALWLKSVNRPRRRRIADWNREIERQRAALRVKYATELALAHYVVQGWIDAGELMSRAS